MVPEKNVTEFFCDADADDDDARRLDPYMSPQLKRAGDTKMATVDTFTLLILKHELFKKIYQKKI